MRQLLRWRSEYFSGQLEGVLVGVDILLFSWPDSCRGQLHVAARHILQLHRTSTAILPPVVVAKND